LVAIQYSGGKRGGLHQSRTATGDTVRIRRRAGENQHNRLGGDPRFDV
jgi:hypothetical protein